MKRTAAALALVVLSACSRNESAQPTNPSPGVTATTAAVAMSAHVRAENVLTVKYAGRWEFVNHRRDGRFRGDSVRSFHEGDAITIVFAGNRLRIYGIRGRNGGVGSIVVPGKPPVNVDFYAPQKQTHVLLYDSGRLRGGIQTAGIVVATPRSPRTRGYVNIDEMEAITLPASRPI